MGAEGCSRTVSGWDITGNVNLNSLELPDFCSCLTQCAGNSGSTVLGKQCQTWCVAQQIPETMSSMNGEPSELSNNIVQND